MPEYIPQVQLPTGLAEELVRMRSQGGAPWAQLAQSLGQNMQGIAETIKEKRQNAITPEQMKGLQQFSQAPAPIGGEKQTFQGGIDPTKKLNPAQQKFLVDTMSQKRTEDRMMALQGLKGNQGVNLEDIKTNHKKEIEEIKAQHAKDMAAYKAAHPSASASRDLQVDKFVQGELDKLDKSINPANATRGTLVGILGQNNARALRALQNLKDPNMVVQQLDAVTQDVAGIMQGGAPHESGIATNRFSNILTKWAALKSTITSDPNAINNPEVVKKLTQIVNDIKKADNQALKDNIDVQMKKISPTSKKYPEFKKASEEMRDSILKGSLLSEEDDKGKYDDVISKVMGGG